MPVVQVGSDEPLSVDDWDSPAGNKNVPVSPDEQFGPFDELFEVVSQTHRESVRTGPLPPRTRFMVRVARVPKPSRTTKRNYNYFEELNSALAQRSATPQAQVGANGQRTTEDWLPVQDSI
jgi:hypothetical protein